MVNEGHCVLKIKSYRIIETHLSSTCYIVILKTEESKKQKKIKNLKTNSFSLVLIEPVKLNKLF